MDTDTFTRVNLILDSASLNRIRGVYAENGVDFINWARQNPRAVYDYLIIPHEATPHSRTIFKVGEGSNELCLDSSELGPDLLGMMLPANAEQSLNPDVSPIIFRLFEDGAEASHRVNGIVPPEMVIALAKPVLSVLVLPPSQLV